MFQKRTKRRKIAAILVLILLLGLLWTGIVRAVLQWEFASAVRQATEISVTYGYSPKPAILHPEDEAFQQIKVLSQSLDLHHPFVFHLLFYYGASNAAGYTVTAVTGQGAREFQFGRATVGDLMFGSHGILICSADLGELAEVVRIAVVDANHEFWTQEVNQNYG